MASRAWILVAAAVLALTVAGNAWVGDDAYITFRSVEQLWAGHGPRWNPHERVQAFTHPSWFAVLAIGRAVSTDMYAVALVASGLALAAVMTMMARLASHALVAAAALLALTASRAVVDYATSGLENGLAAALSVAYVGLVTRSLSTRATPASTTATSVVVALLLCTRHDLSVLVAPSFAMAIWQATREMGWRRAAVRLVIGLSPFLGWTAFSLVYYGFPFPNTAYAKLMTGLDSRALMTQGRAYATDFVVQDTIGALLLAAGIVVGGARRQTRWLALGLAAYVIYVVRIGGDFMSGRFFMVPVVAAVAVLAHAVTWPRLALAGATALVGLSLLQPASPLRVAVAGTDASNAWLEAGIADEKAIYFDSASLRARWRLDPSRPFPSTVWAQKGRSLAASPDRVTVAINIGHTGYFAPLDMRIIDVLALSDPLLARRPAGRPSRVGHYWRLPPDGYVQSVRTDTNQIVDPVLRAYYEDLRLATAGPLFTSARWRAIVRLNTSPPPPWTDRDVPRLEDVPPEWIAQPELLALPR